MTVFDPTRRRRPREAGVVPGHVGSTVALRLASASTALGRLDEALARSPLRVGWIARADIVDAREAVRSQGGLVTMEDFVLHDAGADVSPPTRELAKAVDILRVRRRLASAQGNVVPDGVVCAIVDGVSTPPAPESLEPVDDERVILDEIDAAMAALDAVSRRVSGVAAPDRGDACPSTPVDPSVSCDGHRRDWNRHVSRYDEFPPLLAFALAVDDWIVDPPRPRDGWAFPTVAAATLRAAGVVRAHLPCAETALSKAPARRVAGVPRERRIASILSGIEAAALSGLAELDRLVLARRVFDAALSTKRSHATAFAVADMALRLPIVTTALIQSELGVSASSATAAVAALGLRELSGRRSYRVWAVL